MDNSNVIAALEYLAKCPNVSIDQNQWCEIGIDACTCGVDFETYNSFCSAHPNYSRRQTETNWETWKSKSPNNNPGGYIIDVAQRNGFVLPQYSGRAIGWDEDYSYSERKKPGNTTAATLQQPPEQSHYLGNLQPRPFVNVVPETTPGNIQAATYINVLFSISDNICIAPKINTSQTYSASWLCVLLSDQQNGNNSFAEIAGLDGCYICINPTDGTGRKDENIIAFKYALVESDKMPKDEQLRLIGALNLPCAAVVDSGNKSIHAIVKVNATGKEEYAARVRQLYSVCKDNGLIPDEACKNPSRLSRLPGAVRTLEDGTTQQQRLIATNTGAGSWNEWVQWVQLKEKELKEKEQREQENQRLEIQWAKDYTGDKTPSLPDEYIESLFYPGCKMAIIAPAKIGKTWFSLQLALSLSSGRKWLGLNCKRLKVLYVNVEVQDCFFKNRVEKVRKALNIKEDEYSETFAHITARGLVTEVQQIESLIDQNNEHFDVVFLDPLGKLIEGDENSNSDARVFLQELDRVFLSNNTALIYVHHTGKGQQSNRAVGDRGRGASSLFADVDAQINISELVPNTDEAREYAQLNKKTVNKKPLYPRPVRLRFTNRNDKEPFDVLNTWFEFPIFVPDITGVLTGCYEADTKEAACWLGSQNGGKTTGQERIKNWENINDRIAEAIKRCISDGDDPTADNIFEYYSAVCQDTGIKGTTKSNFKKWLKPSFKACSWGIKDGNVTQVQKDGTEQNKS